MPRRARPYATAPRATARSGCGLSSCDERGAAQLREHVEHARSRAPAAEHAAVEQHGVRQRARGSRSASLRREPSASAAAPRWRARNAATWRVSDRIGHERQAELDQPRAPRLRPRVERARAERSRRRARARPAARSASCARCRRPPSSRCRARSRRPARARLPRAGVCFASRHCCKSCAKRAAGKRASPPPRSAGSHRRASAWSMLSPPSNRWSPTAMRVKRGWPLGASSTRIKREIGGAAAGVDHEHEPQCRERAFASPVRARVPCDRASRRTRLAALRASARAASLRAARLASVSARAASSNEAGTVSTTSCVGERVLPDARRPSARARARGSSRWRRPARSSRTSSGAPHGRIARLAIDAGMAQPALGAGDQPARHAAAERLRELADHAARQRRHRRREAEREVGAGELVLRRVIAKRRQQRARATSPARDQLRDRGTTSIAARRRVAVAGVARVRERDHRVRGAEIDADHVTRALRRSASLMAVVSRVELHLPARAARLARTASSSQRADFGHAGLQAARSLPRRAAAARPASVDLDVLQWP